MHLSSISLENFKDRALIIPEILELIKLHTYKLGLVYIRIIEICIKANLFSVNNLITIFNFEVCSPLELASHVYILCK